MAKFPIINEISHLHNVPIDKDALYHIVHKDGRILIVPPDVHRDIPKIRTGAQEKRLNLLKALTAPNEHQLREIKELEG